MTDSSLPQVFLAEVTTCAGHNRHGPTCNCQQTVNCLLQRMRMDPQMVRDWLESELGEMKP